MKKIWALSASAAAIAMMAAPAAAQIDEVVVTSQRVEQNLQDVPIAVTALTADDLEAAGSNSLEDLNQIVPSLNFRKGTTNANSSLFLRGVGTFTFSIASEPSVSTVVDGVVLSRSGQAFADLYDIERIEVLRGPQGTLFGKNASAGVVNIVTKGGTDKPEAQINLGIWEESEYRAKFSAATPIGGGLSARLTGFYGNFGGHITNRFNGERINGYERWGSRLVFDWDAAESANFRLAVDFARADDDCCAEVTGISRGAVLDSELGFNSALGEDTRVVNHNLTTTTEDTTWGASLQGDFNVFGGHTLTMIGAFRNWENVEMREGDFLPRAIVGTPQLHDIGTVETDQYSFEARLASPQDQRLSYLVGAFYWRSDNGQLFQRDVTQCASSTSPIVAPAGGRPCNLTDFANTIFARASSVSDVDVTNYAFFGNVTFNLNDDLRVVGGLRWTHDSLDYVHTRAPGVNLATGLVVSGIGGIRNDGAGGLIANGGNGTNVSAGSTDNSNLSGRAVVQYDVSDNAMLYVGYSRGYKGPAFNVFFNHVAPTNSVALDAETSNSFEGGVKSRFYDDRLQFNAAVFRAVYDGYQANNFILVNGVPVSTLTNAGQVSSTGFEIDTIFAPAKWWTMTGGIAYVDAKVKQFNPNPATNAPSALNGTKLLLAPKWSISVASEWTAPFIFDTNAHLRSSWAYQSSQFSELGNVGPIDGHSLIDLSLGFSDKDDRYRLTFLVNNLLDDSYVSLNTSAGQRLHIPRDASRYVGATLSAKF